MKLIRFFCLFFAFFGYAVQPKYCVVVDGFSRGQGYPSYFNQMGYLCIHIETDQTGDVFSGYPPQEYEVLLESDGNWEELVETLAQYPIACVVPGSDPGVELAEELNIAFGLPSNVSGSGHLSRNKFLTGETLRSNGEDCGSLIFS